MALSKRVEGKMHYKAQGNHGAFGEGGKINVLCGAG